MKKTVLYSIIFLSTLFCYSQSNDLAKLRFYRNNKLLCSITEFDVQLNGRNIYSFQPQLNETSSFEYLMFSKGNITVKITNWERSWTSSTILNIESGKTYYVSIDCSLGGVKLSTNNISDGDWNSIRASFYESLAEETNNPLIAVSENYIRPAQNTTQSIDTVKKPVPAPVAKDNKYSYQPYADIDFDIKNGSSVNENRFAVIIGNEDYSSFQSELKSASNVEFARNDASTFREYAIKTMGVPERNISFLLDATYGKMQQALNKINLISKNTMGKAEILFFYAGHGMPDETTKESYLIPVDISGTEPSAGIKLRDVYLKLTEFPTARILVFLDACFSGGARMEGLVATRGVSVKPKETALKGNIAVFTSSSDSQSSLSYADKHHGMFTYFLLKKIKENGGDVLLSSLASYVSEKVNLESVIVNNKEQNPQINVSPDITDKWEKWKLTEQN